MILEDTLSWRFWPGLAIGTIGFILIEHQHPKRFMPLMLKRFDAINQEHRGHRIPFAVQENRTLAESRSGPIHAGVRVSPDRKRPPVDDPIAFIAELMAGCQVLDSANDLVDRNHVAATLGHFFIGWHHSLAFNAAKISPAPLFSGG